MARHAAGDRVDGVFDLDALLLQLVGHLAQRVLGLGDGHAVARHDDHLGRILHDEGGIVGAPCLTVRSMPSSPPGPAVSPPKPPRMTEMNERFMPLHMM